MVSDESKELMEVSLNSLFNNGDKYVIPIYQRNYAWGEKERSQLLEDITDFKSFSEEYFLGNLVVYEREEGLFEVIDGQQRLTTLLLLLLALKIIPPEDVLQFEARLKSNNTLKIIYEGKLNNYSDDLHSSELVEAYEEIRKRLSSSIELGDNIKSNLEVVKILRIIVPRDTDLNHYFEIMNTRGEQLEPHEIVKARLMGKIEGENSEEKRGIFNLIWSACSDMGKYVQMSFNSKQRRKIFGENYSKFKYESFNDLINIMSSPNIESLQLEEDVNYTMALDEAIYFYKQKSIPEIDSKDEDNRFESIINFPNFLLQVLKIYNKDVSEDESGLDDKKLLSHFDGLNDPEGFIFLLLKSRFIFDKYLIKREYSRGNNLDGSWSLKSLKSYDNNTSLSVNYINTFGKLGEDSDELNRKILTLQALLRITYTSPKSMHWVTSALIAGLNNNNLSTILLAELESFAKSKVKLSNFESDTGFNINRIVFTYLDYILWRDGYPNDNTLIKPLDDYEVIFRNSIEHFYPQNPDKSEGHEGLDPGPLNSFGNLCLISGSANSKFSNQIPLAKTTNQETIKSSKKLMIMKSIVSEKNKWGTAEINFHRKNMIDILNTSLTN